MDGTEWKIGSFELHVLVLAAQVNGVAIPVYFKVYEHKGVLSERERINFIRKALIIINLEGKLLVADREFIGKGWLSSLIEMQVNFIIRLRKKMYQSYIELSGHTYEKLEKKALKKGYSQATFEMEGYWYKIEMWKSVIQDEPIIYLITNILHQKGIGKQYAKRWKIDGAARAVLL